MPFISRGGISLRYERSGSGRPLVFVHGLMANHTFWDRQAPLRKHFQTVRADLPGHGDSSKARGAYSIARFSDDVSHLVTALKLEGCVLIGSSMGGLVMQRTVPLLPDRVAALVLVGTTARPVNASGHEHGLKPAEAEAFVQLVEQDYKTFTRTLAARLFKDGRTDLLAWAIQQLSKTPPHVAASALSAVFAADHRDAVEAITIPTLICHGRHDAIFSYEAGEYLHEHITGSRLVAFDDSGHLPMLEESERFNSELEAFVKTLD
jgi:non-heme chloroperoxidase